MNFLEFLDEQKENHAVLAFGRMNPPTTGHAKLVDKVKDIAHDVGGSHHIVVSHSQDPAKNPLSAEQKLKHAKRYFPDTNITTSDKAHPNFLSQASKLHKAGVTHLHMVAGSDRTEEYHKLLHKYNGQHGPHGYFNFKDIKVHSAGERDPDAEGVEGMSASKMREHAKNNNFKEFKKGIPKHVVNDHAKDLFKDVRSGMNIKEDFESVIQNILQEGVHDAGIFKAMFLAGGPGSGKDYVLDNTLAGHGLTEINSDKALEFLMDKNNLDKKMPENEREARDLVRGKAKDVTELRQRLALLGRNGLIINGTGDDPAKVAKIKKRLEELGYETGMVMVNTADEVSKQRNIERGQRGGRTVPEEIRKEKWDSVQAARPELAKLFGDKYMEFDNSEDLRQAAPEVVKQKKEEMLNIFKNVQKFVKSAPQNDQAQQWVAGELVKKDTLPIDKKGTEQVQAQPSKEEEKGGAADEARRLGLQYYGYGRYGKNGKVTHHSVHGKLVQDPTHVEQQKQQAAAQKVPNMSSSGSHGTMKPAQVANLQKIRQDAKKKLPESFDADFENFLTESITVTVTADTAEELTQAFTIITGKEKEVEKETNESTLSDNGAFNALTLGKKMEIHESIQRTVKDEKGQTYTSAGGKPRVYALRNNAAKDAHRMNGEVVKTEKGYMVKIKEEANATITEETIRITSEGDAGSSARGSDSTNTVTCGGGEASTGSIRITEESSCEEEGSSKKAKYLSTFKKTIKSKK